MKIIYDDNVQSIVATEADASFPVANLSDEHPKKVWKAVSNDASLTVSVSSGSGIGVANTNAASVTATITGPVTLGWNDADGTLTWNNAAGTLTWDAIGDSGAATSLIDTGTGDIWIDFAEPTGAFNILLELESAVGTILQAGVVRAGTILDLGDPQYGINEGQNDYSIVKQLSNGAMYYRKRDIVRTYNLQLLLDRNTNALNLMRNVGLSLGPQPVMCLLVESGSNSQWIIFAQLKLQQSHDYLTDNMVNVAITEVV